MGRFLDGPFAGQTRLIREPSEELVVGDSVIHGVIGIDAVAFDELPDEVRGDFAFKTEPVRYRRVKVSKLLDDDPMVASGLMVRGAEYEVVGVS